jgi:hypothetical protein
MVMMWRRSVFVFSFISSMDPVSATPLQEATPAARCDAEDTSSGLLLSFPVDESNGHPVAVPGYYIAA